MYITPRKPSTIQFTKTYKDQTVTRTVCLRPTTKTTTPQHGFIIYQPITTSPKTHRTTLNSDHTLTLIPINIHNVKNTKHRHKKYLFQATTTKHPPGPTQTHTLTNNKNYPIGRAWIPEPCCHPKMLQTALGR